MEKGAGGGGVLCPAAGVAIQFGFVGGADPPFSPLQPAWFMSCFTRFTP